MAALARGLVDELLCAGLPPEPARLDLASESLDLVDASPEEGESVLRLVLVVDPREEDQLGRQVGRQSSERSSGQRCGHIRAGGGRIHPIKRAQDASVAGG